MYSQLTGVRCVVVAVWLSRCRRALPEPRAIFRYLDNLVVDPGAMTCEAQNSTICCIVEALGRWRNFGSKYRTRLSCRERRPCFDTPDKLCLHTTQHYNTSNWLHRGVQPFVRIKTYKCQLLIRSKARITNSMSWIWREFVRGATNKTHWQELDF